MNKPTLHQHYLDKVVPALTKKLGYTNIHQVPRLEKIVVTSCMGKAPDRKVAVDDAVNEIQKITGQRPSVTYSKKAVANFKLRENEVLGARVTLRGFCRPRPPRPAISATVSPGPSSAHDISCTRSSPK